MAKTPSYLKGLVCDRAVTRKSSHQFVQKVHENHQAAFEEADASN